VLVNAIYFKGSWESKFLRTKYSPFYATPDKSIQVPMMEQWTKTNYAEDKNLQILEMPYIGRSLSMVVLLPKLIDGLAQIEKDLSSANISYWKARMSTLSVHIFLPKFTIGSGIDLKQTLKDMGMVDAFSLATADFSGMTCNKDMYIGSIVHEAFVEFNEEGTEATAATSVGGYVDGRSTHEKINTFRADHPFLFFIIDKENGSILFIGRFSDPSKLN
jgi:serpin B